MRLKQSILQFWSRRQSLRRRRHFDEDAREVAQLRAEIDKRITDIDARIGRPDDSVKNLGIIQLLNQIEQLNGEIAKLRGQIGSAGQSKRSIGQTAKRFLSGYRHAPSQAGRGCRPRVVPRR